MSRWACDRCGEHGALRVEGESAGEESAGPDVVSGVGGAGRTGARFGHPQHAYAGPERAGDEPCRVGGSARDGDRDTAGDPADSPAGALEHGVEASEPCGGEAGRGEQRQCRGVLFLDGGGDRFGCCLGFGPWFGGDRRGGLGAHGCGEGGGVAGAELGGVECGCLGGALSLPSFACERVGEELAYVVDEPLESVTDGGGAAGGVADPSAQGCGLGCGEGLREGLGGGADGVLFEGADAVGLPFGGVGDAAAVGHHTPSLIR